MRRTRSSSRRAEADASSDAPSQEPKRDSLIPTPIDRGDEAQTDADASRADAHAVAASSADSALPPAPAVPPTADNDAQLLHSPPAQEQSRADSPGSDGAISTVSPPVPAATSVPAHAAPVRHSSDVEPACSICLDPVLHDAATLDCCSHRFCFSCVYQWTTQISSTCPLCKATVRTLTHAGDTIDDDDDDDEVRILDHKLSDAAAAASSSSAAAAAAASPAAPLVVHIPEKLQRVTWEAEETEALPEEIRFARCGVCHRDDNEAQLLLCDGCDRALHTYCIGLDDIPEGEFYCQSCQRDRDEEEEDGTDAAPRRRRLRRARDAPREPRPRSRASSVWLPDSISSRRPHLARGVGPSSLGGLRVPSSRDDAISRLASQLAGLPPPPSRSSSSRAATAATSRAEAARAAATTAARAQSQEGDAWRARQELSFMAQRRKTRQRQHERRPAAASAAPAAASISARGLSSSLQLIRPPPSRAGTNSAASSAFNQPSLQRHIQSFEQQQSQQRNNQWERTTQRTRPTVPAILAPDAGSAAVAAAAASSSSHPLRRRIPKKGETSPVLMRIGSMPSHSPTSATGASAASPTLSLAFGGQNQHHHSRGGYASSPISSPPPHAYAPRSYPSASLHSPLPPASTHRPPVAPSSLARIPSPVTVAGGSSAGRFSGHSPSASPPAVGAAATGAPRGLFWNVGSSPVSAPSFSRAASTPVGKPSAAPGTPAVAISSGSMPRSHEASPADGKGAPRVPSLAGTGDSSLLSPPQSFAAPSPLSSSAVAALPPMPSFTDFESFMHSPDDDGGDADGGMDDQTRRERRRAHKERKHREQRSHDRHDPHRKHRARSSSDSADAQGARDTTAAIDSRNSSHRHHSRDHHRHRRHREVDKRSPTDDDPQQARHRSREERDESKEPQRKRPRHSDDSRQAT